MRRNESTEPREKEPLLTHKKENQGSLAEGPSSLLLLGVNESEFPTLKQCWKESH